jgi:hypothetical protein
LIAEIGTSFVTGPRGIEGAVMREDFKSDYVRGGNGSWRKWPHRGILSIDIQE